MPPVATRCCIQLQGAIPSRAIVWHPQDLRDGLLVWAATWCGPSQPPQFSTRLLVHHYTKFKLLVGIQVCYLMGILS